MTGDSEIVSSRDVKDKDIMYVFVAFFFFFFFFDILTVLASNMSLCYRSCV